MTPHINAQLNDISPLVLMPGDPLRAKFMAETMLTDVKLVNTVRGMHMYTGYYHKTRITIAASGMGCPSIGIYSYELFKFYNVQAIIRTGTAGSYRANLKVKDVVNVTGAYGENDFAEIVLGENTRTVPSDPNLVQLLNQTAKSMNLVLHPGVVHSSDVFYRKNADDWKAISDNENCVAVEMESFALFTNALALKRQAACLLTISDSFLNSAKLTAWERQTSVTTMMELACKVLENLEKIKHIGQ